MLSSLLCWQDNTQVFSVIISLYSTTLRQQWRSASNIATVRFTCCSHCLLNCGFRSLSGWLYGKREDILSTSFMIQLLVFEEKDELSIVMEHQFLLESTIAHYLKLLQPSPHLYSSISTFVVASYLHLCLQSFPLSIENFPTKFSKNFSSSSCLLFHQYHPSCFCWHRTCCYATSYQPPRSSYVQMFTSTLFSRVTCH